jgi:hypothetical protein
LAEHGHPRRIDEIQPRQVAQRRVGIERLIRKQPAAAVAGDPARAETIDSKSHIPPGAYLIGDFRGVAGESAAAMQHNYRWIRSGANGMVADQC